MRRHANTCDETFKEQTTNFHMGVARGRGRGKGRSRRHANTTICDEPSKEQTTNFHIGVARRHGASKIVKITPFTCVLLVADT